MTKDTYYFPHDYHARHDPKLSALIKEFGMLGYGVYWDFVEILHEQGGRIEKFPKLYEGLARELNMDEAKLKQIIFASIKDFCLFQEDEKYIWSNRVLENFEKRSLISSQRAEAGRVGGIKSGEKRSKNKHLLEAIEANEAKESKVKESKVNKKLNKPFLDFSYLEKDNITALIKTFGSKDAVLEHLKGMGFYERRIVEAFEKAGVYA